MFLEGIALGGICGIVIGTIIAFTLGESSIEAIRRIVDNWFPRKNTVPFKYLSQ
jgi:divalent metal cation (Fe/Co/Zn/Cd) transporter